MRGLVEGVVVTLIGALAAWGAYLTPPAPYEGETWAGLVPMGAAVLLLLTGLGMSVTALKTAAASGDAGEAKSARTALGVLGLAVLAVIYQQAIGLFGYVLPTALCGPIVLAAFGVRNLAGLAASAVLCPLVFHLIFFELLGVFPPFGEAFDLLDAIRG